LSRYAETDDDDERRKGETVAVGFFCVILDLMPGGNGLAFDPIRTLHMKRGEFVSDEQKRNKEKLIKTNGT